VFVIDAEGDIMSIMDMIRKQKEKFRQQQHKTALRRAQDDANRTMKENQRSAELAQIAKLKIEDKRQLEANQKLINEANGPSKMMLFGQGLQKAMKAGKQHMAKVKLQKAKKGNFANFGGGNNQGSSGINMGGESNNSPFSQGEGRSPFNVESKPFDFGLRKKE
jgi:hypothetical protein